MHDRTSTTPLPVLEVRRTTDALSATLSPEDALVQSMPDASPTKWHLAHTTWFFETFVIAASDKAYRPFSATYDYLFNSYYDGVGKRHCRARRGLLSRPSLDEVRAYRRHVDLRLAEMPPRDANGPIGRALAVGMHHEQQHQELVLTDIKHAFGENPLLPAFLRPVPTPLDAPAPALTWHPMDGGVHTIGRPTRESLRATLDAFAFDNEAPEHAVFVQPFQIASRLVTCGEYQAFINDGGYTRPSLWLSDGWAAVKRNGWTAPLYWHQPSLFTLHGTRPIVASEPVCHVSYYEADAFARWASARLPTEAEWEVAATTTSAGSILDGTFLESGTLHPRAVTAALSPAVTAARSGAHAQPKGTLAQMFGDVWQWTSSAYAPYPGFVPFEGVLGEYNGKFMCNQMVLRGGSCVTPRSHIRASYRNFFGPEARWQFSGIRLARNT